MHARHAAPQPRMCWPRTPLSTPPHLRLKCTSSLFQKSMEQLRCGARTRHEMSGDSPGGRLRTASSGSSTAPISVKYACRRTEGWVGGWVGGQAQAKQGWATGAGACAAGSQCVRHGGLSPHPALGRGPPVLAAAAAEHSRPARLQRSAQQQCARQQQAQQQQAQQQQAGAPSPPPLGHSPCCRPRAATARCTLESACTSWS